MARRFTVDFEEDFYKDFSKRCIDEDRTKADVVRELLREWTYDDEDTE
ncbi:hypothetical protein ACLI4R_19165 [Natrialbaceae archaeon A-chndr2]